VLFRSRVVKDISVINRYIAGVYSPARMPPLFIMGHSWGSFLVQGFIEELGPSAKSSAPPIAGCILSGTRGPGNPEVVLGAPFLTVLAALKGPRNPSKLAIGMAFGSYNKPFRPNRSPFDWLSRDDKAVDAYIADPLSGNPCSSGFFRDLTGGLKAIHRRKAIQGIPSDLPVYVFCGAADPVGSMGTGPTNLVNAYRAKGISDLEFVVYPDARHETLNETNREEVAEDLLNWLLRHSANGN
jgi:alpha-beta hydrolase superfamily lysophospholipase